MTFHFIKKKLLSTCVLLIAFFSTAFWKGFGGEVFSQTRMLDAKFIAENYYKGVVKILLYDSAAAKKDSSLAYIGRGSGFIVSEDGIIFTNRHVIDTCVYGYAHYDKYDEQTNTTNSYRAEYSEDFLRDSDIVKINFVSYAAPIIQVYFGKGENDYKLYYAKVLSVSMGSFDGAMLKIVSDLNGNPIKDPFLALPLANSDSTFQGEDLCVYGFPEQYKGDFNVMLKNTSTLTFGKHSGFDFVYNKDFGYIKTEASINRGNSGGPVFNADEKIIGIATAAFTETNTGLVGGINGMYYVVASNIELLQKLSAKGLKVPKNAGSINTVNGDHKPIFSQTQIDALNKKKQSDFDARMEKKQKEIQAMTMKNYLSNTRPRQFSLDVEAGGSSYARGTLDNFWQTINNDPSMKAKGKGNPFIWSAELNFEGVDKKEKNFWGFGIQLIKTSNNAIAASNEYSGVTNAVSLNLMLINWSFIYCHAVGKKIILVFEPSVIYVNSMKGSITAYGSTYKEKESGGIGFGGGWQLSAGANYMLTKSFGISFRGGYRFVTLQEQHDESRDGTGITLTNSFFVNGTDGNTTMVKWSGAYCTAGIILTGGGGKRKPSRKKS